VSTSATEKVGKGGTAGPPKDLMVRGFVVLIPVLGEFAVLFRVAAKATLGKRPKFTPGLVPKRGKACKTSIIALHARKLALAEPCRVADIEPEPELVGIETATAHAACGFGQ
jgi:hypothetical protein